MKIEDYKLGQKVSLYGRIDAIDIANIHDKENTTTLKINTNTRTISVNPKWEEVTIDLDQPKPVVPQFVAELLKEQMNKQEAIEKINDLWSFTLEDGPFEVDLINKNQVLDIISQIQEQQKVTIPKFVAEWIEEAKEGECSLCTAFGLVDGDSRNFDWLFNGDKSNQDTFARAWLDGYEVEHEKLYTVEIPNPNLNAHNILRKTMEGIVLVAVRNARWKEQESNKLTESEIKQDFEWAWQFAKEVTE